MVVPPDFSDPGTVSHHSLSLLAFSEVERVERLGDSGHSCEGDKTMASVQALSAKGSTELLETCWIDVTKRMLGITDIIKGEQDVDAGLE